MLVKFQSSKAGELIMFAATARQALAVLRKEPTARGVITVEELPVAIAMATRAIERAKSGTPPVPDPQDPALPIGLAQRLVPFVDFLQRTRRNDGYVMWEAARDFGDA